ncbi:hypothetical protein JTB14_014276 [Gonioctena quinquepunctata]|nr:hypothetical protein JTB14_014276 [Gonioctena quinquepunctata]
MEGDNEKSSFWKKNSKPIAGRPSPRREVKDAKKSPGATSFQDFQASVSDAWDLDDDEFCILSGLESTKISKRVAQSAALNVLNTHRNASECEASSERKVAKKSHISDSESHKINRIPGSSTGLANSTGAV